MKEQDIDHECTRLEKYLAAAAQGSGLAVAKLLRDDRTAASPYRAHGMLKGHLTLAHRVIAHEALSPATDAPEETARKQARNGRLPVDWEALFKNTNPLRIEVCAGNGEWVCERARKAPHVNWVAVEMRYERVFQIWQRAQIMHLNNIVVIWGEATSALSHCFPDASVQQIYVNFPDPPAWAGATSRLITPAFLAACNALLVKAKLRLLPRAGSSSSAGANGEESQDTSHEDVQGDFGQGHLSFMTDDAGYAHDVAREVLTSSQHLFETGLPSGDVFTSATPPQYGNSYFHRFFGAGAKNKRYYFKLMRKKVTAESLAAAVAATEERTRRQEAFRVQREEQKRLEAVAKQAEKAAAGGAATGKEKEAAVKAAAAAKAAAKKAAEAAKGLGEDVSEDDDDDVNIDDSNNDDDDDEDEDAEDEDEDEDEDEEDEADASESGSDRDDSDVAPASKRARPATSASNKASSLSVSVEDLGGNVAFSDVSDTEETVSGSGTDSDDDDDDDSADAESSESEIEEKKRQAKGKGKAAPVKAAAAAVVKSAAKAVAGKKRA